METIWLSLRADLTPVYRMIFRRLHDRRLDWIQSLRSSLRQVSARMAAHAVTHLSLPEHHERVPKLDPVTVLERLPILDRRSINAGQSLVRQVM
jgi:hypothetical protein